MYVQNAVNSRDLDETVAAVKRWLEDPKNNRWLLVYDNYDDVEFRTQDSSKQTTRCVVTDTESNVRGTVSKTYDIRPYFPETEHGAISITTRSSSVGRLGQSIQLEKLCDIQESIEILASTSGRVDFSKDPGSKLLAQKLDGLPLALATAGAYLNKVSTSSTEYIQMYEISWLQLQEQSPHLLEYDRALYSTWNVSLRHIQLQNQYAVKLLRLWGHFDNYDLWYELLQAGRLKKPAWLHKITKDRPSFDAAMRVLCEYGLAEPNAYSQADWRPESRGYTVVFEDQGQLEDARMMCERILQAYDTTLESSILEFFVPALDMLHSLAGSFEEQDEAFKAMSCYQQAQKGFLDVFGPDDDQYIDICYQISSLQSSMKELTISPDAA
ncbi:hypothetical protein CGCF413_v006972 [Colletotrichum fructicola]|nr:hypothetical protein CGCF413_v006972 [Colletotrichum fructicola]